MINTQLTDDQNSDHVTTKVDIPAPSGRGEDSDGTAEMIQLMHDSYSLIAQEAVSQRNRKQLIWKIDTWLAQRGSPMVGCAEFYVQGQERTGIPATLSVGIAEAESSSGMRTYHSHTKDCPGESYNAWGMISPAYYGGFGSWENGIRANFDWLVRYYSCPQSMSDCHGYCEGDGTMGTVDAVMRMINSLDASGVQ